MITQTNNATDNTEAMDDFYLCVDVIIVKTRSLGPFPCIKIVIILFFPLLASPLNYTDFYFAKTPGKVKLN